MLKIINFLKLQDAKIDQLPKMGHLKYNYLLWVAMCYMTLMILSGLLVYKIVQIGPFMSGGGIFLVPILYCLSNVTTEVYGYPIGRNMMWGFIIASTIFTILASLLIHLPSPSNFHHQNAFNLILGSMPIIFIAGTIGTICGLSTDNYIVSKSKILMEGKSYWIRSAISTCGGEIIYNIIAYPIMFLGRVSLTDFFHIFLSVTLFKIIMTILFLAPECFLARYLKLKEKVNVFDYDVNYNIFRIKFYDDKAKPIFRIVH